MKLKVQAKLDPQFAPLSIVCRDMREATAKDGQDIIIAIERNKVNAVTVDKIHYLFVVVRRQLFKHHRGKKGDGNSRKYSPTRGAVDFFRLVVLLI